MAKKSTPDHQELSAATLNIFADQPAAIQVGPYVTKFTLGVIEDDDGDFPRPVVTIAMPTINLMRMVADMQTLFTDPEFKRDSAKMLAEDSKKFFDSRPKMAARPQLKVAKPTAK